MNKITFPLEPRMQGPNVGDLQTGLQLLLDKAIIVPNDPSARRALAAGLAREHTEQTYGDSTREAVSAFQGERHLEVSGAVDEATAIALNRLLDELSAPGDEQSAYTVKGTVRFADGAPAAGVMVSAVDRDLRSEQVLGQSQTDRQGFYQIQYSARQFGKAEKGTADLAIKAIAADGSVLAASPVLFNAPLVAKIDLTLPDGVLQPATLFEKIGHVLPPLLEGLKVEELEEDKNHQDLTFLSGETGFEKSALARFVLAHRLAHGGIRAEFWFVLLGSSFYQFSESHSLTEQFPTILEALPSLDAASVRKAMTRGFNQKEISEAFRENVAGWTEAFLKFVDRRLLKETGKPSFVKLALDDARITDATKQEKFARLFNEHKALTSELLDALEKDTSFRKEEIADLRTSFELSDLTQADFTVVKMLKSELGVRQPEKIRTLARKSEDEWVQLVKAKHAAGEIKLPIEVRGIADQVTLPEAEIYGRTLERQFREAFPTTAFTGGLGRALQNGGTRGLRRADVLHRFLDRHESFELLNTSIDDFLKNSAHPDFQPLARDESFKLEIKAVQRLFKLAPTFEATDALLADDLHSAQKIYRVGQTEFVRRYSGQPGFTPETARLAWNRAADTHAAVLTFVVDLKGLEADALPMVLKNNNEALSQFPNWNNLFKTGDLCECEHCRSVLSPAAYFADLLMFLSARDSRTGHGMAKDVLFGRRADLGFLELNCDNALVPLPYIDVVCEVLEAAVDATGENDIELTGFTAMPADAVAARSAVVQAFTDAFADTNPANEDKQKIPLGASFTLSQVDPADPDRWVVHGDDVTYLLKKKTTANFFAEILRNTKTSAAELRAYPQYVNPRAYNRLRAERFPLSLPFDLFAEEVRAAFQKTNLQRWDLMGTLHGTAAPNDATDGEIAAEYFGISTDANAAFDEMRLILVADTTVAGQQVVWGETGADWLSTVGNVKNFLQKTSLEYNELLALLDLPFINPTGEITIIHLDASCDTDQKVIQILNPKRLDRIHRFLRMWRKLKGWKMWELDLVIRQPRIGNGSLNEVFLISLFHFGQLRNRLGGKTAVEHVCALFDDLNTETRFTQLHEKREDAIYQSLFLNRRLINPLDLAFQIDRVTGNLPADQTITDPARLPVVLAALGLSEADLTIFLGLTRASDGSLYIADPPQLTLNNLSFLWRHSWLAKQLKFKAEEWRTVLKIFQQDQFQFANPEAAWEFLTKIDHLKAAGFSPDELNWLLAADRSAKAAVQEADAARFLTSLRKELQTIQSEYNADDEQRFPFLNVSPPTDVDSLTALLTSLLQKLNRDETATNVFLKTLRGSVLLEASVQGLPDNFAFPAVITAAPNHIPIEYDQELEVLRFAGVMTGFGKQRFAYGGDRKCRLCSRH